MTEIRVTQQAVVVPNWSSNRNAAESAIEYFVRCGLITGRIEKGINDHVAVMIYGSHNRRCMFASRLVEELQAIGVPAVVKVRA